MIVVENVTKVYHMRRGRHTVLDNINMRIAKGEKVGILGHNGAGKSTLIRLIGGVELPTRGHVYRGMSVSWPLAFSGGFQGSLTGLDNLRFICRIYGTDIRTAVPFVKEFSELGTYLREPLKNYSSGMRARLAFALSLAVEFDCFLTDEVIAVGDSAFQEKCHYEMFERRKDRAMIIVSHGADYIRQHCDTLFVLDKGRAIRFENIDDAFDYYHAHASRI
ncbi:MAG: ABC transporter ATP-binding protein [Candidatus Methylumidiphilus sp.]